jgi:hypothetical protein
MGAIIDLNSGSGFVYGESGAVCDAGVRINALIDAALESAARAKPPRDYLGGIAAAPDFYLCRMCPYARRCWEGDA